MAKYAKWIGGGLGWALGGGPIGAIIGFALGSIFDSAVDFKVLKDKTGTVTTPGDFGLALLVLTAAIMKADNKVMKSELDYVKDFFNRQFGPYYTKERMLLLREILKQEFSIKDVCLQIKQHLDHPSRLQLVHFLFGIARADGEIANVEIDLIETMARYLGISQVDFTSIKAMFVKDTSSAYLILEVDKTASDEDVKKAYRKMAVKYHPDKVGHLGEEFQKAAQEKFQGVQQAYEQIKKERGLS